MREEPWSLDDVSRRGFLRRVAVGTGYAATGGALATLLDACGSGSSASSAWPKGPDGVTAVPTAPFDPTIAAGPKPAGLPKRLGFVEPASNETQTAFATGLRAGTDKYGLSLAIANADGKAVTAVNETGTLLARGVGGLLTEALDASQSPSKLQAIKSGAIVFDVSPPITCMITADQHANGHALGVAAATYIKEHLGGRAQVLLMNEGPVPFLAPRYAGIREAINAVGPGTKIVADIPAQPVTQDNGFKITNTVLQAHPDINVILGVDDLVLGALSALEASKKVKPDMFLGGIDGSKEAVSKIQAGGPYKASIGFNFAAIGYAVAKSTRDWLDGKNIPQVMQVAPTTIQTPAQIARWNRDIANPTSVDPAYLALAGNISYAKRNLYIKAPK